MTIKCKNIKCCNCRVHGNEICKNPKHSTCVSVAFLPLDPPSPISTYAMLILYNLHNVSPVDHPSYVC